MQSKGRFKFERIGAPQPGDMARIAADRAVELLRDIDPAVVPFFKCVYRLCCGLLPSFDSLGLIYLI